LFAWPAERVGMFPMFAVTSFGLPPSAVVSLRDKSIAEHMRFKAACRTAKSRSFECLLPTYSGS
jgi:hypothetical protein